MKYNLQNASLQITAGLPSQFPNRPLPHIVFVGRSNVGKSSLLNTLLGRKSLARVSSAPGKTITVNFYNVDDKLYLVDLPGYGFAKRPPEERERWSKLTDSYVRSAKEKRLYLVLIDCKSGPTKDDLTMVNYLYAAGLPYRIVVTKCDKPNKTDREEMLSSLRKTAGVPVIPFSALTGEGRDEVWGQIDAFLDA